MSEAPGGIAEWRLTESLFSGLELATREYGKDQRAAWSFAVATVVNFLKQMGVEPRLLRPLRALSSAVDDLKYGIVDEGLKPAPFEGGPDAVLDAVGRTMPESLGRRGGSWRRRTPSPLIIQRANAESGPSRAMPPAEMCRSSAGPRRAPSAPS
jgi:hypothetical protein